VKFSLRGTPRHIPCIEFVELVTDYLEGVLPARERRAFEHHLTLCDGCVSYVEQMRETLRLTGALQIEDVPDAGVEKLMASFRAYQAERVDEPSG
jgi:anti-sigma factor RsiW